MTSSELPQRKRRVGIVLFDQVEDIDYGGPLTVFGMASQLAPEALETITVAKTRAPVATSMGVSVIPHADFDSAGPIDILVVAGGAGHRAAMKNEELLSWIATRAKGAEIVASVCSGSFILAAAGVLRDQPATAAWMAIERLRSTFPDLDVREGVRWVDEGQVVSSAGASAGIDMSLHLVERLLGPTIAARVVKHMSYTGWPVRADVHAGG